MPATSIKKSSEIGMLNMASPGMKQEQRHFQPVFKNALTSGSFSVGRARFNDPVTDYRRRKIFHACD